MLSAFTTYTSNRSTPPENASAISTEAPRSTKLLTASSALSGKISPLGLGGRLTGT